MSNLNKHEIKRAYQKRILEAVNEDYNDGYNSQDHTAETLANHLRQRFESEYGFKIEQKGLNYAMAYWLQGLALDLDYTNHDILTTAEKLGISFERETDNKREKAEQAFLDNYWSVMAQYAVEIAYRTNSRIPKLFEDFDKGNIKDV